VRVARRVVVTGWLAGYCGGGRYPDSGGRSAAGRARHEKVRWQAAEWFAEGYAAGDSPAVDGVSRLSTADQTRDIVVGEVRSGRGKERKGPKLPAKSHREASPLRGAHLCKLSPG
jgi:hypothetical protein